MSDTYELDEQTVWISVDEIQVGTNIRNIRTVFDEAQIVQLAESIYKDGLLNPLVVMVGQDATAGKEIIELVCGARRLRAVQYILTNLDPDWNEGTVKCTQFTGSLESAILLNGVENVERAEVDAVDTSAWLFWLTEDCGHTQDELATRLHRSPQWVSSHITVHKRGTDALKQALREGIVSFSTAYALAKLPAEEQDKRIEKARKNNEKLTLSEVELSRDLDKVAKPSKKKLGDLLHKAEQAATNPRKRNAHGVAMGLRFVLGLVTEDEAIEAVQWEDEDAPTETEVAVSTSTEVEAPSDSEAAEAETTEDPESTPRRRRGRASRE